MKRVILAALLLTLATSAASADIIPLTIDMDFYAQISQTAVWSAELSADFITTISGVRVTDLQRMGGSDGAFSGFDIDLLLFDVDGDLETTDDQIQPFTGLATYIEAGKIRNPATTTYKAAGGLFGLTEGGLIDHSEATLGTLDGHYEPLALATETSGGFVTLGDGGSLTAAFPLFSLMDLDSVHLFVGDAGINDEGLSSVVDIEFVTAPNVGSVVDETNQAKGPIEVSPNVPALLELTEEDPNQGPTVWLWDIDGDGEYDDAVGRELGLTFDRLTGQFGLPLGEHVIRVIADDGKNATTSYETVINITPEPASLAVLGLGSLAVVLRRRG